MWLEYLLGNPIFLFCYCLHLQRDIALSVHLFGLSTSCFFETRFWGLAQAGLGLLAVLLPQLCAPEHKPGAKQSAWAALPVEGNPDASWRCPARVRVEVETDWAVSRQCQHACFLALCMVIFSCMTEKVYLEKDQRSLLHSGTSMEVHGAWALKVSILTKPKPVHSRLDNLLSAMISAYEGRVPSRPAQFFSPQRLLLCLPSLRVQRQLSLNSQRRQSTQFMHVLPFSSLCVVAFYPF